MNILLIGKDVSKVAKDIHGVYSKCHIVELNGRMNSPEFLDFVKNNKSIVIVDTDYVYDNYTINQVIDFCEKNNFTISIVASSKKCKEAVLYMALEERIPRMILWERNTNNEEYDDFLIISGVNLAHDKTV